MAINTLIAQSSDTSGPFSFDHGSSFELEAEFAKEINRRCEVVDDDAYIVQSPKVSLQSTRRRSSNKGRLRRPKTDSLPGAIRCCPHQKYGPPQTATPCSNDL